jgi:cellulose synthase (UDP-forming)
MDLDTVALSRLLLGDALFLTGLSALLSICDSRWVLVRVVISVGTIALGIRYLVWRWSQTIDWSTPDVLGFAWPLIFVVFETSRQVDCLHAVMTMARTSDRRPQADQYEAQLRAAGTADLPRVDVFIPTYNEPWEVLSRTVIGTKALDWPHLRIFVLDDGARPWVAALCAAEGVDYIERRNGRDAKAGNINHGLSITQGPDAAPFILMLDADFVPFRNFLWRTLGFFQDERIAIVQTPQYFFNPDPVQMNLGSPENWAEEQRFFFDAMQPSKDAWGMAFCCGSSCVLRRAAIEAIGGVPTGAVIEDIHLSYVLMANGWITRYLNETLSNGLASESLGEFVGQRVRWAIGCGQALRLRFGPFGSNGLSLWQRVFYLSTITYWLNLTFVLIYIASPPIYWFFGVSAYRADLASLAVFQAPYLIASQLFLIWTGRGRIIPAVWEAVQIVFALEVTRAIFPMLVTGSVRGTRATQKGLEEETRVTVNWRLLWHILVLGVLNVAGIAWGQFSDLRNGPSRLADQVNIFWSINALVILGIASMLCVEQPRRRRHQRFKVSEPVWLSSETYVELVDISVSGARLALEEGPIRLNFLWRGLPLAGFRVRTEAGASAYHFDRSVVDERALNRLIFTSGLKAQTERIHFGGFVLTLVGRLLFRPKGDFPAASG